MRTNPHNSYFIHKTLFCLLSFPSPFVIASRWQELSLKFFPPECLFLDSPASRGLKRFVFFTIVTKLFDLQQINSAF